MQLIGMLDSPYVRRVAISLRLLKIPHEHRAISVFRHLPAFTAINPVVKVPTLIPDEGPLMMDSTLILDYAEALAAARAHPSRSLMPAALAERQRVWALLGLALAAYEKSVQIVYERNVRPPEKLHQPWVDRVTGQLLAACDALEAALQARPLAVSSATIDQAGVTAAVGWYFIQALVPDVVPAARCPALAAHSAQAEMLPEFAAAPHGEAAFSYSGDPANG